MPSLEEIPIKDHFNQAALMFFVQEAKVWGFKGLVQAPCAFQMGFPTPTPNLWHQRVWGQMLAPTLMTRRPSEPPLSQL